MGTVSRLARVEKAPLVLRQVLTFVLGSEAFGMDISCVREVIEYGGVTSVPMMPNFVRGVINLRGEVVPILDLSLRIGRKACVLHRRSCIVIVDVPDQDEGHVLGLIVDAVSEVVEIAEADIEMAPRFGLKLRSEFVQGVAKQNERFIVLLDAGSVLSLDELAALVADESDANTTAETDIQ